MQVKIPATSKSALAAKGNKSTAPQAQAFGCTFYMCPSFCLKLSAEDNVLMAAFATYPGLAIMLRAEVQPSSRLSETLAAEKFTSSALVRTGAVGPAEALMASDLLGPDACRVLAEPNAGGTSRVSEAMTVEVLSRAFGARLLQTEMEIVYWPSGSAITDFSVCLSGACVGVSVTRAMGQPGAPYTPAAAESLLRKKLDGVVRSTETCLGAWAKQILVVWAPTAAAADALEAAYGRIEPQLTSDTVVLIAVCADLAVLFEERAKAAGGAGSAAPARALKGAKDESHLRVLAESDPLKVEAVQNVRRGAASK